MAQLTLAQQCCQWGSAQLWALCSAYIKRRLALWKTLTGWMRRLKSGRIGNGPIGDQTPTWRLHLDDSTFFKKLELAIIAESMSGKTGPEQEQMRKAYQFWGIPYNVKKAIVETDQAERLGAFLDGKGRIGVTVQRMLEKFSLGLWVLSKGLAGKEVRCLQFRRALYMAADCGT